MIIHLLCRAPLDDPQGMHFIAAAFRELKDAEASLALLPPAVRESSHIEAYDTAHGDPWSLAQEHPHGPMPPDLRAAWLASDRPRRGSSAESPPARL